VFDLYLGVINSYIGISRFQYNIEIFNIKNNKKKENRHSVVILLLTKKERNKENKNKEKYLNTKGMSFDLICYG
jgi:hypothetical protein